MQVQILLSLSIEWYYIDQFHNVRCYLAPWDLGDGVLIFVYRDKFLCSVNHVNVLTDFLVKKIVKLNYYL